MKKLVLIFLFFSFFLNAQINVIEYKYIYDQNTVAINSSEFLVYRNENSLYFRYGIADEDLSFANFKNDQFDKFKLNYFILNSNEDLLYELGTKMPPTKILVEDKIPKINWNVKNEYKKILGYNCSKAEGRFRGRDYTAWFTTELPFQVGPWKLHGLPGTILEAYDVGRISNYYATKINLNIEYEISKEFQSYINEKKLNIIQMKKYINGENEYLRSINSQILANMPFGAKFKSDNLRDSQKEVIFEWESETAKK